MPAVLQMWQYNRGESDGTVTDERLEFVAEIVQFCALRWRHDVRLRLSVAGKRPAMKNGSGGGCRPIGKVDHLEKEGGRNDLRCSGMKPPSVKAEVVSRNVWRISSTESYRATAAHGRHGHARAA